MFVKIIATTQCKKLDEHGPNLMKGLNPGFGLKSDSFRKNISHYLNDLTNSDSE